jgi:hypothetical protein
MKAPQMSCEFCDPRLAAAALLPAGSFVCTGPDGSVLVADPQDWAACRVCAAQFLAGRWRDLADRAVAAYLDRHRDSTTDPATLRVRISGVHQALHAARTGPSVLLPIGGAR